jgi:mannose-6-phosphate isomerase-like protein (cupin superfamily)
MLITNKENAAIGKYDGFLTNLLIGELNSGSKEISIQITDVEPNVMQFIHSHEEEQCYYIVSGTGKMFIDDEIQEVNKGDAIFMPSNSMHGIEYIGEDVLTYLTANKAFGIKKEKEIWSDKNTL